MIVLVAVDTAARATGEVEKRATAAVQEPSKGDAHKGEKHMTFKRRKRENGGVVDGLTVTA